MFSSASHFLRSPTMVTASIGKISDLVTKSYLSSQLRTATITKSNMLHGNIQVETKQNMVIPPNLKIDPRSTCSPYYGLAKVSKSLSRMEKTVPAVTSSPTANKAYKDETYPQDELVASESNKVESDYDLSTNMEPTYAIPLPERLHIPIYHFTSVSERVGSFYLSSDVFGQDPIRTDILHRCVVYQRNKKRGLRNAGARTKTVSEVSGSGRKVRNQKGGGIARAGHRRPAHWRGGAKAHGPKGNIQNYTTKLNKKVRRLGIKMALSQKLKEGNLLVINGFEHMDSHKTKSLVTALEKLGKIGGRHGCTAYLIDHVDDKDVDPSTIVTSVDGVHVNLKVASSNIFKIKVSSQRSLNVYDILKHQKLVLSLGAVQALESRLVNEES